MNRQIHTVNLPSHSLPSAKKLSSATGPSGFNASAKLVLYICFFISATLACYSPVQGQQTLVKFLSGIDKDNTIAWDFMCTAGHNSGKWTTIPVPSNWEFQGFGNYTYGSEKEDASEAGLYRYQFTVPTSFANKEVNIVFDGSMTDTEVKINGQLAGAIHQGAFYRFKYNITKLLKAGNNLLEVKVNKVSSNQLVNEAERTADFWIFGGIFRPVFLEAFPKQHIDRVAIDAKGDGTINVNVFPAGMIETQSIVAQVKTKAGKPVGAPFKMAVHPTDSLVHLQAKLPGIKPWSPEFPTLYSIDISLVKGAAAMHTVTQTIGFRTVELRAHDGFYVNGNKVKFKGVNRGSFWPTSGRTTSRAVSRLDANLIKDMNMNAVRMSHYSPDDHFLEICDSIGLFIIDELTGWQYPPYDTETGRKLVKELIYKDQNHPSIVLWANGNEGGFNFDLLPDYPRHDAQHRPVIQPWMNINGMNTKHYIPYNYGVNTFFQGDDVFFPTEFLHGLYDGGHGAGLDDFWNLMMSNPLSAGGFLWDFCDQGAARTDQNGRLDTKGNAAADGILGPYREKEGSFYTIKEIWSPLYFPKRFITADFDGNLTIENRYDLTNLRQCKFSWRLKKINSLSPADTASIKGNVASPNVAAKTAGILHLALPANWQTFDVLYITATDSYGREINEWSWPITTPAAMAKKMLPVSTGAVSATQADSLLTLQANGVTAVINLNSGVLASVRNSRGNVAFNNGPILISGDAGQATVTHRDTLGTQVVRVNYTGRQRFQFTWTMLPSGVLQLRYQYRPETAEEMLGVTFSYPEEAVQGIQLLANGPYHVYKNRLKGTTLDSWNKTYNNTVTGETWNYPEFKGYYSNFYGGRIHSTQGDFSIYTSTDALFLHLLNPAVPKGLGRANSMAPYPKTGNISFMNGIPAIGTKTQNKIDLGPQSQPNITFANGGNDMQMGTLFFDFR